jgi:hypothetical protein
MMIVDHDIDDDDIGDIDDDDIVDDDDIDDHDDIDDDDDDDLLVLLHSGDYIRCDEYS